MDHRWRNASTRLTCKQVCGAFFLINEWLMKQSPAHCGKCPLGNWSWVVEDMLFNKPQKDTKQLSSIFPASAPVQMPPLTSPDDGLRLEHVSQIYLFLPQLLLKFLSQPYRSNIVHSLRLSFRSKENKVSRAPVCTGVSRNIIHIFSMTGINSKFSVLCRV